MNQNFHRNIITYFFSYVLENGKIKGKSDLAKAKEQLEVSQQTLTNITVPRSILRWHGMKNMLIEDNDDR